MAQYAAATPANHPWAAEQTLQLVGGSCCSSFAAFTWTPHDCTLWSVAQTTIPSPLQWLTFPDRRLPDMPGRMQARYPAAFSEVISVGAVDKFGNAALYSDYPAWPPQQNGIATYGGGLPTAEPSSPDPGVVTPVDVTKPIDALLGVYSSLTYPALSADDPVKDYTAPSKSAWAYWPGTSFATPIISAVAARLLELHASSLPSHLWATQVQWAITTAKGQQTMLTDNGPLSLQPEFGVSMLMAVQRCKRKENE